MPDLAHLTPTLAGQLYETTPGLLIKRWGESSDVVFQPGQNSTHLVDALAGQLLQQLHKTPSELPAQEAGSDSLGLAQTLAALLQAGMVREVRR